MFSGIIKSPLIDHPMPPQFTLSPPHEDLPLRASYRVAKLRDGACAYGSQSTLDRIGGADIQGPGSRRGSVSLMSEIGAQYYRLVEKYESLLLRRTESSLGQVRESLDLGENEADQWTFPAYLSMTDWPITDSHYLTWAS